jgi:SAM-dependent methyltransferase
MNLSTEPGEAPADPIAPIAPLERLDWRIGLYDMYRTNPCGWYRWIFGRIVARPDAHVMDIGCGTARFWQVNRDRIPVGWHVFLADKSRDMANHVQQTVKPLLRCTVAPIIVDAPIIPFPDKSLDAILAMHVLHLVQDLEDLLREVRRVLKKNGRLYATAGSLMRLKHLDAFGTACCPAVKVLEKDPRKSFCAENGKGILISHGFRNVRDMEYKDTIEFEDLETLFRYIRTTDGSSKAALEHPSIDALTEFFQAMLLTDGRITVNNDAALFEARP